MPLPCELNGLFDWAVESIRHCKKESLLLYLRKHKDADGLLVAGARPAIVSKSWKCSSHQALGALEAKLAKELRGYGDADPRQRAREATVVSLDELAVRVCWPSSNQGKWSLLQRVLRLTVCPRATGARHARRKAARPRAP